MENRVFSHPPHEPEPPEWRFDRNNRYRELERAAALTIGETEADLGVFHGLTEQIAEASYDTVSYGGDGKNGRPLITGYQLGLKKIPPGVPESFSDTQKDCVRKIIQDATKLTGKELFPGQHSQKKAEFTATLGAYGSSDPDIFEAGTIATALVYDKSGSDTLLDDHIHQVVDPSLKDKVFYALAVQHAKRMDKVGINTFLQKISTPQLRESAQWGVDAVISHLATASSKKLELHTTVAYIDLVANVALRLRLSELYGRNVIKKIIATRKQESREARKRQMAEMLLNV